MYSRSRVDRAGQGIRRAFRSGILPTDDDLGVAEAFRLRHLAPTQTLQASLVTLFHEGASLPEEHFPIGSRLKTPGSIVAKLMRSSIRFSQMQDIAGARVLVPTIRLQDLAVHAITTALYPDYLRVDDQREESDEIGYRAVHIIVRVNGCLGEIQVRSWTQDQWAQLVESLDSGLGLDLKHGQGDADWLQWLQQMSEQMRRADLGEPYQLPPTPRSPT